MRKLYDQIDAAGNLVVSGIKLQPGMVLPEGHAWIEHVPDLAKLRQEKKEYIEKSRDKHCFSNVYALGHWWQADARSQQLLSTAINLSAAGVAPAPATWRTLDNVDLQVTLDQLKEIAATMSSQVSYAYSKSWELKQLLQAANTKFDIDNIVW